MKSRHYYITRTSVYEERSAAIFRRAWPEGVIWSKRGRSSYIRLFSTSERYYLNRCNQLYSYTHTHNPQTISRLLSQSGRADTVRVKPQTGERMVRDRFAGRDGTERRSGVVFRDEGTGAAIGTIYYVDKNVTLRTGMAGAGRGTNTGPAHVKKKHMSTTSATAFAGADTTSRPFTTGDTLRMSARGSATTRATSAAQGTMRIPQSGRWDQQLLGGYILVSGHWLGKGRSVYATLRRFWPESVAHVLFTRR